MAVMPKREYLRAVNTVYPYMPKSTRFNFDYFSNIEARLRLVALHIMHNISMLHTPTRRYNTPQERYLRWRNTRILDIAAKAKYQSDEHGFSTKGDHWTVIPLDFIPPWKSKAYPFLDHGGEGLALIKLIRKRVYANSSKWYPSCVATHFLVGKNESGTYFGHPVSDKYKTIFGALDWIWSGQADNIIARQGDIALVKASGPKMPVLPHGHEINGNVIAHRTHEPLRLPGTGERIIVARRAAERAGWATRD